MKPSEFVAEVADELKTNGWIQGQMHSDKGSCLLGAMTDVGFRHLKQEGVEGSVLPWHHAQHFMECRLHNQGRTASVVFFNDYPGRTLNEVLGFLHECQVGLKEME